MRNCFVPADLLLPDGKFLDKWAVIACDQYTSDKSYWDQVKKHVAGLPSALNLILPEAYLEQATEETIRQIHKKMDEYYADGVFTEYSNSFVYVERTLQDGSVRKGILGMIDLEQYDFEPTAKTLVRATEQTVLERIPPRMSIRKDALLEFSHVIVFCDDPDKRIISSVSNQKHSLPLLYDFELQQGGGRVCGWLICGAQADALCNMLERYAENYSDPTCYLVADGNHSLVTAKRCYEQLDPAIRKNTPARYAMVELENIHSSAVKFEPIHRLLTQTDAKRLLDDLVQVCDDGGVQITWVSEKSTGSITIKTGPNELPVAAFQRFLDQWLVHNPGEIDYIHDDDALMRLADKENTIGFIMPPVDKSALFTYVAAGNTLPRKTFSLGHAAEKRYYLEGRRIK